MSLDAALGWVEKIRSPSTPRCMNSNAFFCLSVRLEVGALLLSQELEVAVELGHPSPEVDGGVSGMLEVGCRGGNWDGPVVCHGCSPALSSSGGEWKVSPAWAKAGQSKLEGRWGVGQAAVPAAPSFWLGAGGQVFFFFCTGVANCGVGRREEERSYFIGREQTHRMRERGVSRLGHSYWVFSCIEYFRRTQQKEESLCIKSIFSYFIPWKFLT